MSFSKTVSVCAALASIFAAGTAGYKLSQTSQVNQTQETSSYEQRISELEKELENAKTQVTNTNPPAPVVLPQPSTFKPPVPVQLPPPPTSTSTPEPPATPQPPSP